MRIYRISNTFEVKKRLGDDAIACFADLESARKFLAGHGNGDAKGPTNKGLLTVFGEDVAIEHTSKIHIKGNYPVIMPILEMTTLDEALGKNGVL